jgi:hypothetical protein
LDYFVADSVFHPFGNKKFGIVVALNLLENVEPPKLLNVISTQVNHGTILLSDPYDYDRGHSSVRYPIYEKDIRKRLKNFGFIISVKTKKPSFIPWNLIVNKRTNLNYNVDVILGKKL